jgi:NAD(P)H-flavin reductase
MLPIPYTIERVVPETHDTFTLALTPPQGRFAFAPGQFNMLYVFGVGEVPISISGAAERPEELVHTVRAVGTVTRAMRDLPEGAAVGVRGPFGTPWPVDAIDGHDLVVIAGGIGLAPLRPVVYHALANRDRYRRVWLLYGTRSPRDILYDAELMEWRGRFDLEVEVTVDRGDDEWRGKSGVVTKLVDKVDVDPERTVAMICGPEIMMRFSARELRSRGLPLESIWVTMERNMQCAIAQCGHCQYGPELLCRDGVVYRYDRVARLFPVREV